MKKKILLGLLALFGLNTVNAETLIYRGSAAQQRFEKREPDSLIFKGDALNTVKAPAPTTPGNFSNNIDINDKRVIGNFNLSNIQGVDSKLSINEDGTFFWYMTYKKTVLETTGNWSYIDQSNGIISLTTSPMPGDIGFNFKHSDNVGSRLPSLMAMGSYEFHITYDPKTDFDKKGPLKDVLITCAGPYGMVTAKTDENGFAVCTRAGYPLKFLKLKAPKIQNETTFVNPKFVGFSWNFTFDYERAHTGYAFYKERMQMVDGKLIWDGASLGANQKWEYLK